MVHKYFKAKFTLAFLASILFGVSPSFGQFTTPTIDGTIGASEYGSSHSVTVDSRVWNLTWDDSNLYIGVSGHTNFGDAIVIYIDVDNLSPINSGSNSNGTASGTGYDGVTPNFPFRADFFAFIKDTYDDYKTDDGTGSWGASTTGSLTKSFSDANDVGEFAIPWSAITGSGRPSAFNFVGFMSYSGGGGGTFARIPSNNPSGVSADYVRYYNVSNTADGSSTTPFSQESYCFVGSADATGFGSISVYDFTMNSTGRSITRAASGAWTIANDFIVNDGTIDYGTSSDVIDVAGDVTIGSSGTLSLSSTSGGDLNVGGDFNLNGGTLTNNSRAVFFDGSAAQSVGGTSDPVTFDYMVVSNTSATVGMAQNVTVSNDLTVNASATLNTNSNTLTVSGTTTLDSDNSGNYGQIIGAVSGGNTINVERTFTGSGRWFYAASPVSSGTVSGWSVSDGSIITSAGGTSNQVNIYYYDPSTANSGEGTWTAVPNTSFATTDNGFGLYLGDGTYFGTLPITLTASGTALNDGAINIALDNSNSGWNLVPNPYPSAIDWNTYHDANSTDLTSTYYIYNGSQWIGYDANTDSPLNSGSQYIAPMQAFFVQNTGSGSINLALDNADRILTESPSQSKTNSTAQVLKLKVASADGISDETLLAFSSQYTDAWDNGLDAVKRMNTTLYPSLYTTNANGDQFFANKLNESFSSKSVDLSFKSGLEQSYTISINDLRLPASWLVELEDKLTGTRVDLKTSSYQFMHVPGNLADRFVIHINQTGVSVKEQALNNNYAYNTENGFKVVCGQTLPQVDMYLFNQAGQLVWQGHFDEVQEQEVLTTALSAGVYILKVESKKAPVFTQKLIK